MIRIFLLFIESIMAGGSQSIAKVLTVSKPGGVGVYNTVMTALQNARSGDSVVKIDNDVYDEQVTIDSTENGLVLTSVNQTLKIKPPLQRI